VSDRRLILVVDDIPNNIKLLADILTARGYAVCTASSGIEALELVRKERPDLVLLDVVMPEMSGYEVCRKIRENPDTRLLPVVMVTALDPGEERVKGIDAGADDFLEKPIRQEELLARVRSLLRVKELHDTVQTQAEQLAMWSRTLEQRVEEQVVQLERLSRLRRFFAPQIVEMIVSGGAEDLLKSHRRKITVVFVDLRGFTAFADTEEPEEVMRALQEFHTELGRLITESPGTLERFTGDGMMVFFNDPVEIPNPEEEAVRLAVAMRDSAERLHGRWAKRGYDLGFGAGIAGGYATLGAIGFEGRFDYAAIGRVTILASCLCDHAPTGHILVAQKVLGVVENLVESEPFGELNLKGFTRPIPAHNILSLKV